MMRGDIYIEDENENENVGMRFDGRGSGSMAPGREFFLFWELECISLRKGEEGVTSMAT